MTKIMKPQLIIYLLIVALFPLIFSGSHIQSVLIVTGLQAMVTIGLCLLMGYSGQISLGQAAFWGLGAYTSGILTTSFDLSPFLGLLAAGVVSAFFALILAWAIAGLNGYYLAMATLAFGFVIQIGISQWESVTGGANGLIGIPSIPFFGDSELGMYYFVWGLVTLVLLFSLNLVNSRVGRAYRAIHKSEVAATSMGIRSSKLKLSAFVVSGIFAGVSGGVYAHYIGIIDPQPFGFHESILFITMVVVGGMTSVWGALIGTIIISLVLNEGLAALGHVFPEMKGDIDTIVYGAILILIVVFMQEGLVPRLRSMVQKLKVQRTERKASV